MNKPVPSRITTLMMPTRMTPLLLIKDVLDDLDSCFGPVWGVGSQETACDVRVCGVAQVDSGGLASRVRRLRVIRSRRRFLPPRRLLRRTRLPRGTSVLQVKEDVDRQKQQQLSSPGNRFKN